MSRRPRSGACSQVPALSWPEQRMPTHARTREAQHNSTWRKRTDLQLPTVPFTPRDLTGDACRFVPRGTPCLPRTCPCCLPEGVTPQLQGSRRSVCSWELCTEGHALYYTGVRGQEGPGMVAQLSGVRVFMGGRTQGSQGEAAQVRGVLHPVSGKGDQEMDTDASPGHRDRWPHKEGAEDRRGVVSGR